MAKADRSFLIDVAKDIQLCYTYDSQDRLKSVTVKDLAEHLIDKQTFSYDAKTNIISAGDLCSSHHYDYDGNNRMLSYNGGSISYDMDGNMLNTYVNLKNIALNFDSSNRLIKADNTEYTYTAEDVRIKSVTGNSVTTYTYNTNTRLSQLLTKTTGGVVTKYVYGLGLIGEECNNNFKTYHFDYRGSTTEITDENGNITDTFKYDAYGNLTARTGTTNTPFLFNGKDGVMTEQNGLIYMRARYYNPEIRRFINADIIAGDIENRASLNRYAYAEGNPVSNVDPTGFWSINKAWNAFLDWGKKDIVDPVVNLAKEKFKKIENIGLLIDGMFPTAQTRFDNNNDVDDYTDGIIYDQNELSKFYLGEYSIEDVGCEVVAIYNAKVLLGYTDLSFKNTIKSIEDAGALTFQDICKGSFGSNPYALPRVFKDSGMKYSAIHGFDDLSESGIYIISFWNSNDFDSMLHTIAVEVDENGKARPHNGYIDTKNQRFVSGYKVSRNK